MAGPSLGLPSPLYTAPSPSLMSLLSQDIPYLLQPPLSPQIFRIFKASALWADAFIESQCVSVCLSVCLSVECPLLCIFFEAPHWPSGHMINWRPLIGGVRGKEEKKIKWNAEMLKSFLAAVLLSPSVESCFVSRMRDFFLHLNVSVNLFLWYICMYWE